MRILLPLLLLPLLSGSARPVSPALPPGTQVAQEDEWAGQEGVPKLPGRVGRALKLREKLDPAFLLRSLDGRHVLFRELRGKTVLFVFWSSRCPYSRNAEPKLVQLAKDYARKDVLVVAVNANVTEIGTKQVNGSGMTKKAIAASYRATYPELVRHYVRRKLNFAVVIDTRNKLADVLGAKVTPEAFLFDGKGRLRYAGAIDDDPKNEKLEKRQPYLRQALDAVLADQEPTRTRAKATGCTIKRVGSGVAGRPAR